MEQQVKCRQLLTRADDARCKKRCTKKRNCGKHKCNQECCIDIDHVCPLPCQFNLSCGKHKCDQTCHKGRCQRCYRSSFVELYCECGANVIYPPVPCGSKKPACDRPCGRTHPCEHPVQHTCHSATACPPCMAFTTVYCYGKHEQRKTIPCSQGEFSCGLKCNRALRCGRHKCVRICHADACETDKDVCRQLCTKQRIMCGHACGAPCHKDAVCPADLPCREQVEVLCQCGNRKQMRTCQDFSTEYRRIASAKFASTMEDMQRGSTIELSDVLGPVKLNNNKTWVSLKTKNEYPHFAHKIKSQKNVYRKTFFGQFFSFDYYLFVPNPTAWTVTRNVKCWNATVNLQFVCKFVTQICLQNWRQNIRNSLKAGPKKILSWWPWFMTNCPSWWNWPNRANNALAVIHFQRWTGKNDRYARLRRQ